MRADDVARRLLEDADELAADDLALLLGVGDPGERAEEALLGVDDDEVDAGRGDEVLLDLLGLARAQQPVVDEDAGQLVADGLLHEGRGDRGVDAAGQPADDPGLADLRADARRPGPRRRWRRSTRPTSPAPSDEEVLEHLLAERRVQHLGVPLHAVEPALVVLEAGDRGARRRRGDLIPAGAADTASPWLIHTDCSVGLPVEQRRRRVETGAGVPPYSDRPGLLDRAAERLRHGLEAVAHAEHRHPGLEAARGRARERPPRRPTTARRRG